MKVLDASHKVVKNSIILYVKMAMTVFISLYTTRLLLEALGIDGYGLFFLVAGIISLFMFLNAGMVVSVQRFMSHSNGENNPTKQKQIFNIAWRLHLVVAMMTVTLLELIQPLLFNNLLNINSSHHDIAVTIYHLAVINVFFLIISVPYDAAINAHEEMLVFAYIGITESILKLIIALFLFEIEDPSRLFVFASAITAIVIFTFIWKFAHSHRNYKEIEFSKKFNIIEAKKMINFAGWSLLGNFSSILAFYGQNIVLNIFHGTSANAAHAVAGQLNGQLNAIAHTMLKAVNPMIVKSEGAGNRKLMLSSSIMSSKIGFFLLTMLYVPFLLNIEYIMNIWLTTIPDLAIIFCTWWLIKSLFEQLFLPLVTAIDAVGNIKVYQLISSLISISPLLISYLILKEGMAAYFLHITFFIFSLIQGIWIIFYAKNKCELSLRSFINDVLFRSITVLSITIVTLTTIAQFIEVQTPISLLLVFSASIITTSGVFWLIGLNKSQKGFIKNYLAHLIKNKIPQV